MMKNRDDKFSFIRYSNCWEDTEILLDGLSIKEGEVGLSVASGGDNTISMLVNNPKKIYAFDINNTQLFCTEVKIKAIEYFTYEELLSFLGVKDSNNREEMFYYLKPKLSYEAYNYFNNNIEIIKKGLIHCGKFEKYFKLFREYVCPIFCNHRKIEEFSKLSDCREQFAFYSKYINNFRFKLLFKIYFGVKVMGKLGRDKSFYRYVDEKKSTSNDIKFRFENGISNIINSTNPYLCYILNGNYRENSLPYYLKPENYIVIKHNIKNIELLNSSILDINDELKFDFINLSDIFEYMNESDFNENIKKLYKISNEKSRIAYWNMQNKRYFQNDLFYTDLSFNKKLFNKNKSFFYRDFYIYERI